MYLVIKYVAWTISWILNENALDFDIQILGDFSVGHYNTTWVAIRTLMFSISEKYLLLLKIKKIYLIWGL